MPVEQLGEQRHTPSVGPIRPHASHGKNYDRRITEGLSEFADEAIDRPVNCAQTLTSGPRGRQLVQGMRWINAVPQALDGRMQLTGDDEAKLPVRKAGVQQPTCGLGA